MNQLATVAISKIDNTLKINQSTNISKSWILCKSKKLIKTGKILGKIFIIAINCWDHQAPRTALKINQSTNFPKSDVWREKTFFSSDYSFCREFDVEHCAIYQFSKKVMFGGKNGFFKWLLILSEIWCRSSWWNSHVDIFKNNKVISKILYRFG